MKSYTSEEIQNVSSSFRNVAQRLLRTDVEQCDANLKRFMAFIEDNGLIISFINENNTHHYNIAQIIKNREWLHPFDISPIVTEEIAFEYQLLKFAIDERDGDFTSLYYPYYIHTKGTHNDNARDFMRHIVDPLVDYITNFLKQKYNEALKKEKKNTPDSSGMVTAHNSTVLVNSSMQGNISNNVMIDNSIKEDANAIIKQIEEIIPEYTKAEDTEDIKEILTEIKDEIAKGNKPKKPLLIALKATGSILVKVAPLAIKLYELLTATT